MSAPDATQAGIDWPVVLEAWASCARTPMGAAAVRAAGPLADRREVEVALDACDEVLRLEAERVPLPVGDVQDLRPDARRAAKGIVLEPEALRGAASALRALHELARSLAEGAVLAPSLAAVGSRIVLDRGTAETLEVAFDPLGELSGTTYPELKALRATLAALQQEVRATLDRLVRSDEREALAKAGRFTGRTVGLGDDLLQDRYWTVRDGRYVLPVKSHAKRWDLGIVHGTSNTGQTVYVEPHAVVELNNQTKLAEGRLRAAEYAILAELSRLLGAGAADVEMALEAAIEIDLAVSRAGLATRLDAHRPTVGDGAILRLRDARHPVLVLRGVHVVANDLEVGAERPVLVLSGPNAGGKTVALKTFALCAELVRHGLFVPAVAGSRVDLFPTIRAVIGDRQTVEGDLSSFSAHLVGLAELVDGAAPGQLLLVDEIASGTDPAQGAALGQAVLERLADRGPRVVATTHFAALKGLAATDERFAVAAVEVLDGRPTYRVLPGVAGESHALAVAARVGLPASVLDRALELLGSQQAELGRLLRDLDEERGRAASATAAAERDRAEAARAAAVIAEREELLRTRIRDLEQRGAAAFLERLRSAEIAIGRVVADLQRAPSHERARAARAAVGALGSLADVTDDDGPTAEPQRLERGDRVRHLRLGGPGEVVSADGETVEVRIGSLVVRARRDELELVGRGAGAGSR